MASKSDARVADNGDNLVPLAAVVAVALLRLQFLQPSKRGTRAADNRDNIVPIAVVVTAVLLSAAAAAADKMLRRPIIVTLVSL